MEQMAVKNKYSKQFCIELGRLLQQQAINTDNCIVKMLQPHVHQATGPLFHLGERIVKELDLRPAHYLPKRSKAELNPASAQTLTASLHHGTEDVEPKTSSECVASVLNGTSAHKRLFSAMQ